MILRGKPAIKNDMAIEQSPHGIDQWVLLVVSFHQHAVKSGNASGAEMAGPFDQLGEHREYRRLISLCGGRLPRSQPDLTLRHRHARKRINHQKPTPNGPAISAP